MTVSVRVRKPTRMARPDVSGHAAIRRRGLRQPGRITDRAEIDRRCMDVVADRLEPLQNGLPLFPIQLAEERPQSLDERILEQRLPSDSGMKKRLRPTFSASEIFSSVPRLGVICPLSMRER